MQNLKIMNSKEKKELFNKIKEQYDADLEDLENYVFLINPKNKIFIISKDFANISTEGLRINSLGLYFGEIYNDELRLSIEGSQLLKAKKNILELNDEDTDKWLQGLDIELSYLDEKYKNGFYIIKNKNYILGCGKLLNKKLFNYVPKERRVN